MESEFGYTQKCGEITKRASKDCILLFMWSKMVMMKYCRGNHTKCSEPFKDLQTKIRNQLLLFFGLIFILAIFPFARNTSEKISVVVSMNEPESHNFQVEIKSI